MEWVDSWLWWVRGAVVVVVWVVRGTSRFVMDYAPIVIRLVVFARIESDDQSIKDRNKSPREV